MEEGAAGWDCRAAQAKRLLSLQVAYFEKNETQERVAAVERGYTHETGSAEVRIALPIRHVFWKEVVRMQNSFPQRHSDWRVH